jgi:hypothetical protein
MINKIKITLIYPIILMFTFAGYANTLDITQQSTKEIYNLIQIINSNLDYLDKKEKVYTYSTENTKFLYVLSTEKSTSINSIYVIKQNSDSIIIYEYKEPLLIENINKLKMQSSVKQMNDSLQEIFNELRLKSQNDDQQKIISAFLNANINRIISESSIIITIQNKGHRFPEGYHITEERKLNNGYWIASSSDLKDEHLFSLSKKIIIDSSNSNNDLKIHETTYPEPIRKKHGEFIIDEYTAETVHYNKLQISNNKNNYKYETQVNQAFFQESPIVTTQKFFIKDNIFYLTQDSQGNQYQYYFSDLKSPYFGMLKRKSNQDDTLAEIYSYDNQGNVSDIDHISYGGIYDDFKSYKYNENKLVNASNSNIIYSFQSDKVQHKKNIKFLSDGSQYEVVYTFNSPIQTTIEIIKLIDNKKEHIANYVYVYTDESQNKIKNVELTLNDGTFYETKFDYNSEGMVSAIYQPDDVRINYTYKNNQLYKLRINDGDEEVLYQYGYNLNNQVNSRTLVSSNGRKDYFSYDLLGRRVEYRCLPRNFDNGILQTNEEGIVRTNTGSCPMQVNGDTMLQNIVDYDGLGRLKYSYIKLYDLDENITTYKYGKIGTYNSYLKTVNNSNEEFNLLDRDNKYNSITKLMSIQKSKNVFWIEDSFGRLLSSKDNNIKYDYIYDPFDKLIEKKRAEDIIVKNIYDANNRLILSIHENSFPVFYLPTGKVYKYHFISDIKDDLGIDYNRDSLDTFGGRTVEKHEYFIALNNQMLEIQKPTTFIDGIQDVAEPFMFLINLSQGQLYSNEDAFNYMFNKVAEGESPDFIYFTRQSIINDSISAGNLLLMPVIPVVNQILDLKNYVNFQEYNNRKFWLRRAQNSMVPLMGNFATSLYASSYNNSSLADHATGAMIGEGVILAAMAMGGMDSSKMKDPREVALSSYIELQELGYKSKDIMAIMKEISDNFFEEGNEALGKSFLHLAWNDPFKPPFGRDFPSSIPCDLTRIYDDQKLIAIANNFELSDQFPKKDFLDNMKKMRENIKEIKKNPNKIHDILRDDNFLVRIHSFELDDLIERMGEEDATEYVDSLYEMIEQEISKESDNMTWKDYFNKKDKFQKFALDRYRNNTQFVIVDDDMLDRVISKKINLENIEQEKTIATQENMKKEKLINEAKPLIKTYYRLKDVNQDFQKELKKNKPLNNRFKRLIKATQSSNSDTITITEINQLKKILDSYDSSYFDKI